VRREQTDRNLDLDNRRTRKRIFLDEMERIVPRQDDMALFNRHAYVFTVKTYATSVRHLSSRMLPTRLNIESPMLNTIPGFVQENDECIR